jgi:hypothetical protein
MRECVYEVVLNFLIVPITQIILDFNKCEGAKSSYVFQTVGVSCHTVISDFVLHFYLFVCITIMYYKLSELENNIFLPNTCHTCIY